jgi:hypothetical protein
MKKISIVFIALLFPLFASSQAIIINHNCTQIKQIPESAILAAKQKLHIAYGHTSHGSQVTDGMSGLVTFMNGLGYPNNLYAWNNGGTSGALDLHDYAMGGDVGYYPDWVNNTRTYLGTPDAITGRGTGANADVNVIIWSWCGQVSGKYAAGTLTSEYLTPMTQLETDYPGIKFIYMTGHLDHSADASNKAANQAIRDFCTANNKILYDFADIESYNPDKTFFQYSSDDCSYYSAAGTLLGNWATEWQSSHTVNVDWYSCSSAHSQPLNANQKAYGAWWLWARLAGWNGIPTGIEDQQTNIKPVTVFPNPSYGLIYVKSAESRVYSIEIFNVIGTKIFSIQDISLLTSGNIDLTGQPKGLYLMKISGGAKPYVEKIIIR